MHQRGRQAETQSALAFQLSETTQPILEKFGLIDRGGLVRGLTPEQPTAVRADSVPCGDRRLEETAAAADRAAARFAFGGARRDEHASVVARREAASPEAREIPLFKHGLYRHRVKLGQRRLRRRCGESRPGLLLRVQAGQTGADVSTTLAAAAALAACTVARATHGAAWAGRLPAAVDAPTAHIQGGREDQQPAKIASQVHDKSRVAREADD